MDATQQLTFLQERIEEIGSAIFYNLSSAVLKLPTAIVSTAKVDNQGYVWFFVQKPTQQLSEFEQEFPVKMDFYKKGKGYFLQVSGKGFVVKDGEGLSGSMNLPEGMTLIKVKMQRADYYETHSAGKANWWQSAWYTVTTWFRHQSYRTENTYFPAA